MKHAELREWFTEASAILFWALVALPLVAFLVVYATGDIIR